MSVWILFLLVLEVRIFIFFFKTLQNQELVILTFIKCGFAIFCYCCSPQPRKLYFLLEMDTEVPLFKKCMFKSLLLESFIY